MHYQLYKEDVMERIKEYPEFEEYSLDQLKQDLDALVEWKNLTPIQDPKRVYTIAEYKNKQFRYSMSEYAVEIERLTVKLENLFLESGNLSPSYFVRIEEAVENATRMEEKPLKVINEWWNNLQEDFKRLNQNYQDYLREFYSSNTDKLLKSVEFILHKDRFISYLREFIQELQINASRIESLFRKISEAEECELLALVVKSEMEIPRTNSEVQESLEMYIKDIVFGRWEALKNWFLPTENRLSESSRVLDITDEVIRKIIQNAALIVQLQNWGISRRNDYKKFISMFLSCNDLEEAHKLAAHIFGIQHIRHFKVNSDRSTDSINSSIFEEEPATYELRPKVRAYREKVDKSGFEAKSMEKLSQRMAYLKQVEEDRKMVMKYVKDGGLDIAEIQDVVSVNTRLTLLRWIAAANTTNSKIGRTEYGQAFQLVKRAGYCVLKCEDGDLKMPAFKLQFMEEKTR